MKTQLLDELKSIAGAIKISDPVSLHFNGEHYPVMNRQAHQHHYLPFDQFGQNKPAPGAGDYYTNENLVNTLSGILYSQCYCFPFAKSSEKSPLKNVLPMDEEGKQFVDELSRSNFTREGWDRGWVVYNTDGKGQAFVKKNGELMHLMPDAYRFTDPQRQALKPNTPVDIKIKKEDKNIQPGFYFVYSENLPEQSAGLIRFYWNVSPAGASKLVQAISTAFNRAKIPFRFKCLSHPGMYESRADGSVLYLEKRHFKIGCLVIKGLLPALRPYLKEETPLFARRLYRGLSFAEDPMDGSSFGMHRSGLLARGLVSAHRKNYDEIDDRLAEVDRVFAENGIDLDKPYLNPNSYYQYDFPDYSTLDQSIKS